MKLYFTPGACPLAAHIVLCELGLPHELIQVDLKTKRLADGTDFTTINPKGYVPALVLDSGELLTEIPAITQYLADTHPERGLLDKPGTLTRTRAVEWLTFTGTELHRNFSPLFNPSAPEEWKQMSLDKLMQRLAYVDQELAGKDYILGKDFCIADAYLFTVLNWTFLRNIDISSMPNLVAYHQRVKARPAVQQAMKEQGIL